MGWKQELWPEWQVEEDIGAGAYGTVYKIKRQDIGGTYYAALKVISFPQNRDEIESVRCKHVSDDEISQYYYGKALELSKEITVMERLKGHSNIVSYEDHKIVQHRHDLGWDILIRMELLKSLPEYLETTAISENDVCKIGMDICNALILCEKEKMIHRDIKPANIFVSEFGDFKLGDFNLAKYVGSSLEDSTPRGTFNYMAPEVYYGKEYDYSIDIYSLGLILYRLLNRGRGPFQPLPPEILSSEICDKANYKRLHSEITQKPIDASPTMASIILKACSYNRAYRYKNAMELQKVLSRHCSSEPGVDAKDAIRYFINKAITLIQDPDDKTKSINDYIKEERKKDLPAKTMEDFFNVAGDL